MSGYEVGLIVGAVTTSFVWWLAYRELDKAYDRVQVDEHRYFDAWLETLDQLYRERDVRERPTATRDTYADDPGADL